MFGYVIQNAEIKFSEKNVVACERNHIGLALHADRLSSNLEKNLFLGS